MPKDAKQYVRQLKQLEPPDDNISQAITEAIEFFINKDNVSLSDIVEYLEERGYSNFEIGIAIGTFKTATDKRILNSAQNMLVLSTIKKIKEGCEEYVRNRNSENSKRY